MTNKVAVIVGGTTGIGAASAREFLSRGWDVGITYYPKDAGDGIHSLMAEARQQNRKLWAALADVRDEQSVSAAVEQVLAEYRRVDALICSAGFTRPVPHADLNALTPKDFLDTTAVNTVGPFVMIRAFADALTAGDGGAVVIISSYGAIYGTGSSIAYAASKGATNTLTMSLARVLAPKVRVNSVCPALVRSGFIERLHPDAFAARAKRQVARAPLKRIAEPQDVAKTVYWLAAEDALMTGSVISLDCGLHLNGDA